MKGRWASMGIVLAGVLGALVGDLSCSTSSSVPAGESATTSAAGDAIVIGVSNAQSGGLAGTGTPLLGAIRVAEHTLNSVGGVLGRKLRFVVADDASDEGAIAQQTIRSLLGQGAVAIIGPDGSGQVAAVQDILYKAKVLEISATATSPDLSTLQPRGDRYFFRTVPQDKLQGAAVVRFAVVGPKGIGADAGGPVACTKMALLYLTNAYGTAMAQVIKDTFPQKSGGGAIVADLPVSPQVRANYMEEVSKVVAAKPECLAMIVYDDVGDVFMSDLLLAAGRPASWNPSFFVIGTDGVYTDAFLVNGRQDRSDPRSPTVVEDVYGTNPDTNPDRTQYNDFKALFTAQIPLRAGETDLEPYTANEFDAAILVALAIEQAGTVSDPVKLRDALYAVSKKDNTAFGPGNLVGALAAIRRGEPVHYVGASGDLEFNDLGEVLAGYVVWHVKNGQFETLAHVKPEDLQ